MQVDAGEEDSGEERRVRDRRKEYWHVGKEIPLALIVVVLIQTGGGIWWASALSSKLDSALMTLAEFKAERYTRDDGRRDREFIGVLLEQIRAKDIEIERRMEKLEVQHEPGYGLRSR